MPSRYKRNDQRNLYCGPVLCDTNTPAGAISPMLQANTDLMATGKYAAILNVAVSEGASGFVDTR